MGETTIARQSPFSDHSQRHGDDEEKEDRRDRKVASRIESAAGELKDVGEKKNRGVGVKKPNERSTSRGIPNVVRVRSECKRGGCPRRQCTTFTLFIYTRACTPIPRSEGYCSRGEGCVPLVRIRSERSAGLVCRGRPAGLFPGSILPSIVPRISMSAEEIAASLLNVYPYPHPLYLSLSLSLISLSLSLYLMLNCYVILHHRPLVRVILHSFFLLRLSNFLHFLALFLSLSLSLSLFHPVAFLIVTELLVFCFLFFPIYYSKGETGAASPRSL